MNDEDRLEELVPLWRSSPRAILSFIDQQARMIKQLQEDIPNGNTENQVEVIRVILGDIVESAPDQLGRAIDCLISSPVSFIDIYRGIGNDTSRQHRSPRPANRRTQRRSSRKKTAKGRKAKGKEGS